MKKIVLSMAAIAMLSLVSCGNKEEKDDTTGAVPAKVITDEAVVEDTLTPGEEVTADIEELEIVGGDAIKSEAELQKDNVEDLKNAAKDKYNEAKDAAKDKYNEAKENAKDKYNEAKEATGNALKNAGEKLTK